VEDEVKRVLAFVIGPLVLGVMVYFATRAPDIRLFQWTPAFVIAAVPRIHVPAIVTGSLPDAMWAFAFGSALGLVWKKPSVWMWIGALLTASVELAQAAHLIEGVFDWIDLAAMVAGYFIGWRICRAGISSTRRRDAQRPAPT
jgi:hypothetical protein